tara:strand:- start:1983 stop:2546 length:564 start_codon:yes stop_codon:yes gene_type:complete
MNSCINFSVPAKRLFSNVLSPSLLSQSMGSVKKETTAQTAPAERKGTMQFVVSNDYTESLLGDADRAKELMEVVCVLLHGRKSGLFYSIHNCEDHSFYKYLYQFIKSLLVQEMKSKIRKRSNSFYNDRVFNELVYESKMRSISPKIAETRVHFWRIIFMSQYRVQQCNTIVLIERPKIFFQTNQSMF